jgi:ketosteroid isomerase-like protein
MKRRLRRASRSLLAAVAGLLLLLLAASCARRQRSETSLLIALEHDWLNAAQTRDLRKLDEILDDDFVDTSYKGELRSKRDVLASSAAPPGSSARLENLVVHLHGHTAVVTGSNFVEAADHSFKIELRFTDVFVKRGAAWKAIAAQEVVVGR